MQAPDGFITTKQHRRFGELCDAVRRERYIGLCYGPPGVGKTLSARRYACWDALAPYITSYHVDDDSVVRGATEPRTLLYTPKVHNTPSMLENEVGQLHHGYDYLVNQVLEPEDEDAELVPASRWHRERHVELVIVDEADRLKTPSLEQLRDHHDRTGVGLVLIGMPGLERRLARFPQLYSRIGFAHEYRPLSGEELTFVLAHHWSALGLSLAADDFTDAEAVATVARITGGNFRLVQRVFAQVTRILEINGLTTITREVVETAREALIIGPA